MNFQSPCSDFGKIENLIDQMSQMAGRCLDSLNWPGLLRCQFPINTFTQQVHKPHYRVQRCAQFVRYVRKKLTFHLVDTNQLGRQLFELSGALLKPVRLGTKTTNNKDKNDCPDTNEHPAQACRNII